MIVDWKKWIEQGGEPEHKPLRQAMHIVLLSISKCEGIRKNMLLKGGILMALCYESSRYTRDIDFSQSQKYQEGDEDRLIEELNSAIRQTVEEVDYGLDCRIQSKELKPPSKKNPTFPTLNVKIGYAYKHDQRSHRRLLHGGVPTIVEIDFSFNETTKSAEEFSISEGNTLLRYSLIDLLAEKFRALLQQEERNRYRRQDVYDLFHLINKLPKQLDEIKPEILNALIESAASKNLEICDDSMSDENIRNRTQHEYEQLKQEVAKEILPEFTHAYGVVEDFYRSLPWPDDRQE
jgi:predicted nucleotidyltransferase component of viral defense system